MGAVPYSQEVIFLASVIGGLFLGFLWDIYRLIRHYIHIGSLGTALGDILYCIIGLYISLNILLYISWGNIRVYILLGFLLGAVVYFCIISSAMLGLLVALIDTVIKALKRLINIIIFPFIFLIKRLKNLLIPYKINLDAKVDKAKVKLKFYTYKIRQSREVKKRQNIKRKKLKRLMKEQTNNAKKYKGSKISK